MYIVSACSLGLVLGISGSSGVISVCVLVTFINRLLGILPTIVVDRISILITLLILCLVLHLRVNGHGLSMLRISKLVVSIVILLLLILSWGS